MDKHPRFVEARYVQAVSTGTLIASSIGGILIVVGLGMGIFWAGIPEVTNRWFWVAVVMGAASFTLWRVWFHTFMQGRH